MPFVDHDLYTVGKIFGEHVYFGATLVALSFSLQNQDGKMEWKRYSKFSPLHALCHDFPEGNRSKLFAWAILVYQ